MTDKLNVGSNRSRNWNIPPATSRPLHGDASREFDNSRLALREQVNCPWPTEDAAKAAAGNWEDKQAEEGPRHVARCHLPCDITKPGVIDLFTTLRETLAQIAGGFTEHNAQGGWINEEGDLEVESVITFEVSYVPSYAAGKALYNAFRAAGADLGEVWTHIEHHPHAFVAQHTKTG